MDTLDPDQIRLFIDEICQAPFGGYQRFFWRVTTHYITFWLFTVLIPLITISSYSCWATEYAGFITHALYLVVLYFSIAEEIQCAVWIISRTSRKIAGRDGIDSSPDDDHSSNFANFLRFDAETINFCQFLSLNVNICRGMQVLNTHARNSQVGHSLSLHSSRGNASARRRSKMGTDCLSNLTLDIPFSKMQEEGGSPQCRSQSSSVAVNNRSSSLEEGGGGLGTNMGLGACSSNFSDQQNFSSAGFYDERQEKSSGSGGTPKAADRLDPTSPFASKVAAQAYRFQEFFDDTQDCCSDLLFNKLYYAYRMNENAFLLARTVVWRIDVYLDVIFIFIARNCGSSLWWSSLAVFVVVNVVLQGFLHLLFAFTDCDHQLPRNMGFVLYDFTLINRAVKSKLPFDYDVTVGKLPANGTLTTSLAVNLTNEPNNKATINKATMTPNNRNNSKLSATVTGGNGLGDANSVGMNIEMQDVKSKETVPSVGSKETGGLSSYNPSYNVSASSSIPTKAISINTEPGVLGFDPEGGVPQMDMSNTMNTSPNSTRIGSPSAFIYTGGASLSLISPRGVSWCIMIEKCFLGDVVQVLIQMLFLIDVTTPNNFMVYLSVAFGIMNFSINFINIVLSAIFSWRESALANRLLEERVVELKDWNLNAGSPEEMQNTGPYEASLNTNSKKMFNGNTGSAAAMKGITTSPSDSPNDDTKVSIPAEPT